MCNIALHNKYSDRSQCCRDYYIANYIAISDTMIRKWMSRVFGTSILYTHLGRFIHNQPWHQCVCRRHMNYLFQLRNTVEISARHGNKRTRNKIICIYLYGAEYTVQCGELSRWRTGCVMNKTGAGTVVGQTRTRLNGSGNGRRVHCICGPSIDDNLDSSLRTEAKSLHLGHFFPTLLPLLLFGMFYRPSAWDRVRTEGWVITVGWVTILYCLSIE